MPRGCLCYARLPHHSGARRSGRWADVGALIVPGACFVHSVSEKARTIDRIELQLMQVIGKDRSPIGGIRVQLGIQPRMATTRCPVDCRPHAWEWDESSPAL